MSRYDDINMSDDELSLLGGPGAEADDDEDQGEAAAAAAQPEAKPAANPAKAAAPAAEASGEDGEHAGAEDAAATVDDAEATPDEEDDQGEAKPAKSAKKNKGGYSVPNWRLAEVSEQRDRERREKAALQAELDALKKATAKPAAPAFDIDAAEEQVAMLLSENNPKEAAKLQKQIREEIKRAAKEEAAAEAEALFAQREAERAAAAESLAFSQAVKSAYERYPELDHESDDANEEAINAVIKYSQRFAKAGMPGSEALTEAVETVMSMAKFAKPAPAAKLAPAVKKPAGPTKEQIQAAVDAAKSQPPATSQAGVGNRAAPAARDFSKMSANEIANLSKADMDKYLSGL